MDRFAIFVDAGYLYAGGGQLLYGTTNRGELYLDFPKVTAALLELCRNHCGLTPLRTYWYDAARDGVPTPGHIAIASQKGVKLRLGRLTYGAQKGVDSRIVRDLMTLSRERAIATAYLLSGDDDLREGVVEAQDVGVSVVLIGIEPVPGEYNQARTLVREADDLITLDRDHVTEYLTRREPVPGRPPVVDKSSADPSRIGEEFAKNWLAASTEEDVRQVQRARPNIPRQIDQQLLEHAEASLRSLRGSQQQRRALRAGFWRGLEYEGEGSTGT